MKTRAIVTVLIVAVALGLGNLAAEGWAQPRPQQPGGAQPEFPDLASGLKATPGCLGVELAMTMGGKNVIFAWFEDKRAVERWYYGEMHQKVMDMFFPTGDDEAHHRKPLKGISDDFGPIMVIASITMSDQRQFDETTLPVSQIAIELYAPITGGLFLGGRFAPEGVKVADMSDYTPKKE